MKPLKYGEDLVLVLVVETNPVVLDREPVSVGGDLRSLVLDKRCIDLDDRLDVFPHEFQRIAYDILEELPELCRISFNCR